MTINNLFETAEQQTVTTNSNGRALAGTALLTATSDSISSSMVTIIASEVEQYKDIFEASKSDTSALQELINTIGKIEPTDYEFLKEIDEATLESMLKSQQSKKSRCKGKTMTIENYQSMLSAAIAETMIRLALGKEANTSRRGAQAGTVSYTDEQIATFREDQELLKKEIRNVQSKKSIMKSKADFDEESERWQALLDAEALLKDLRATGGTQTVYVDTVRETLAEMLSEVSVDKLKINEAKELVRAIINIVIPVDDEIIENSETPDGVDNKEEDGQ